jgi:hypothetical protein
VLAGAEAVAYVDVDDPNDVAWFQVLATTDGGVPLPNA